MFVCVREREKERKREREKKRKRKVAVMIYFPTEKLRLLRPTSQATKGSKHYSNLRHKSMNKTRKNKLSIRFREGLARRSNASCNSLCINSEVSTKSEPYILGKDVIMLILIFVGR